MSIRAKLRLLFVLVVGLSGSNVFVQFWSKNQTEASLEELRKATEVQRELGQIERELNDVHKQNAIMGQFISATEDVALRPEQIELFDSQTDSISSRIRSISGQVGVNSTDALEAFAINYNALLKSWRRFYLYFGRDHIQALTELAVNAEPLGIEVMQVHMPELIEREHQRTELARENYYSAAAMTSKITTTTFLGSALILMVVLLSFSRDLIKRLATLRLGAENIGGGDLEHRIDVKSTDELAALAVSFNQMGDKLQLARSELDEQYQKLDKESARSQQLLLNILPESTADELRDKGKVAPQYYSDATVMFADIKGFTLATEKLSVDKLIEILNEYFTAFDKVCDKYNIEKLKTIGDCYMAVAGVPNRRLSHCADMILAGWEFIDVAKELSARDNYPFWQVRVGIHSGPVISGVVGINKFAFDIWGSTVNRAARLEQGGEAGKINISESARAHVRDLFELLPRGEIKTKDKQGVDMYFVQGPHKSLSNSRLPLREAFAERYDVYFRETLTSFPATMPEVETK